MQILLVEPNRVNASIYSRALSKSGHMPCIVGEAEAAIHALDEQSADLVILELQLANHNGVEFLYELRSYPEWQALPILIHSLVPEYQVGLSKQAMQKLGIVGYLYKPITSLRALVDAVDDVAIVTR